MEDDRFDFEISVRVEESAYGKLGTDDCHQVGIWGGCGLNCWVYQEGRCKEPDEMIPRFETEEDREFHMNLYKEVKQ